MDTELIDSLTKHMINLVYGHGHNNAASYNSLWSIDYMA